MTHKFRNIYGISLLDLLRTRTDVGPTMPVLFMHDVNAAMLGEMRCGNARGFANAALIALGTGLGFACCLDGEVQYAPTGSPRITVYKKPFRDGILEDYVAKRGFLRLYGEITGQDTGPSLTVADLGRMAGEGNPAARETFATIGRMLGEALRELIRKERIECLLLGGQISRSYAYLEPGLRKGLSAEHCSGGTHRTCGFLRTSRTTRRPAAGDVMRRGGADRGSSFPPIRHITYHTRTTD